MRIVAKLKLCTALGTRPGAAGLTGHSLFRLVGEGLGPAGTLVAEWRHSHPCLPADGGASSHRTLTDVDLGRFEVGAIRGEVSLALAAASLNADERRRSHEPPTVVVARVAGEL